jgi:hypothetical protein
MNDFDHFVDLFDQTVRYAKANGTFDEGIPDIKALAIRIAKPQRVVHADEITNAQTTHFTLEIDVTSKAISCDEAERVRKRKTGAFFRHRKKGHCILPHSLIRLHTTVFKLVQVYNICDSEMISHERVLAFLMKRFRVVVSVSLGIVWLSATAFAQDNSLGLGDKHVGGDVPIDERLADATRRGQRLFTPPPEDRVLKKGVLAPSRDDRATFAAFLGMPNTGLIRLLPRESLTYQTKKRPPSIPGGGAYYSFANVTHFYGYGSDIELNLGNLSVGSFLGYGLLTNLGDVPLEEVALIDSRSSFIAAYKPAVTFLEARAEALRFRNAVTIDGVRYQDKLPAEVNATYLLRSINYGKPVVGSNASARAVSSARRTDVLVAFRVVRKDTDGSVIIAWKLLKKYSAPKLD